MAELEYDNQNATLFGVGSRIVGGTLAELGDFPSIVSIQRRSGAYHFCAGTLVDRYHIVTAAHCVFDTSVWVQKPGLV